MAEIFWLGGSSGQIRAAGFFHGEAFPTESDVLNQELFRAI